nr:hypothetical protein [Tanacetum cinerariifolium]
MMDLVDYPYDDDEEEPLALALFASPVPDSVPSSEEMEPFEEDRRPQPPLPASTEALVAEFGSAPTPPLPPPSPLSLLSSPLPRIPFPPLLLPSPTRRDMILEADMSPRKRASFAAPSHGFEISESLAADAVRQLGSALTRATELDFMTALEEFKESVINITARHKQDNEEFYTRHQHAQDDRAVLRTCISTLPRKRRYYRHIDIVADMEAMYA